MPASESVKFRLICMGSNLRATECPFRIAGSTGRRNVKSLCRCFKMQGLTWPFVKLTSHFVQMSLRVHRQIGALGKYCLSRPLVFSFDPRCHGLLRPCLPLNGAHVAQEQFTCR